MTNREAKAKAQKLWRLARQLAQQCPEDKADAEYVVECLTKMIALEHGDATIGPLSGLRVVAG